MFPYPQHGRCDRGPYAMSKSPLGGSKDVVRERFALHPQWSAVDDDASDHRDPPPDLSEVDVQTRTNQAMSEVGAGPEPPGG